MPGCAAAARAASSRLPKTRISSTPAASAAAIVVVARSTSKTTTVRPSWWRGSRCFGRRTTSTRTLRTIGDVAPGANVNTYLQASRRIGTFSCGRNGRPHSAHRSTLPRRLYPHPRHNPLSIRWHKSALPRRTPRYRESAHPSRATHISSAASSSRRAGIQELVCPASCPGARCGLCRTAPAQSNRGSEAELRLPRRERMQARRASTAATPGPRPPRPFRPWSAPPCPARPPARAGAAPASPRSSPPGCGSSPRSG